MCKSKKILSLLIIWFVFMANNSFADNLSEKISQINNKIYQLALKCDFDQIRIIKKRFIFSLNFDEISSETLPQIAHLLGFQNDYIFNALVAIEHELSIERNDAINNYWKVYNLPFALLDKYCHTKNIYASYAKEYKLNADIIVETYLDIYGDDTEKTAVRVGAGAGAAAAGTAAIVSATIGGSAAALSAFSAGATATAILSGPVVVILAPALAIGGGAYAGYKSYKKGKLSKKTMPHLKFCVDYYGPPINRSWKQAIIDYKTVVATERNEAIKAAKSIYNYLEANNYNSEQLSIFKEISYNNDAYYYTLDALLRFYLFDEPLRKFIMLNNMRVSMAKSVLNDNEQEIMEIGKELNRAYSIIDNTSLQKTRDMLTEAMTNIKSELNAKEFEQMKMESKLGINWLSQ